MLLAVAVVVGAGVRCRQMRQSTTARGPAGGVSQAQGRACSARLFQRSRPAGGCVRGLRATVSSHGGAGCAICQRGGGSRLCLYLYLCFRAPCAVSPLLASRLVSARLVSGGGRIAVTGS